MSQRKDDRRMTVLDMTGIDFSTVCANRLFILLEEERLDENHEEK
jgi:hypothetical protein